MDFNTTTAVMEERLSAFLSLSEERYRDAKFGDDAPTDKSGDVEMDVEEDDDLPEGWSRIPSSSWKLHISTLAFPD